MGYFDIGTFKRSRKTLEEQARRAVIKATGNENPVIKFSKGTYGRSKKTLEDQVKVMIELNATPPPEPTPEPPTDI